MNNTSFPVTLLCDFYKISHKEQYPTNTNFIYSTWTPRTSRIEGIDKVMCFGLQGFIKEYLIDYFNACFFIRKEEDVIAEYERVIKFALGKEDVDSTHIRELHQLGYLPVEIKAVAEGTLVPLRVPMFTIENTNPRFFWLTNYLETLMSCMLWQPMTSATISLEYRKILDEYAIRTVGSTEGVEFQGHDFSMRGMSSLETAKSSGAGHLLSFVGTDTIPAILYHENYYNANIEKELVGCSVSATEHSVQCAYGQEDELEGYKRLINEIYPSGIISIVSDTWDLWHVITNHLPALKDDIMNRDGKVVIRPDSGDPVKIICGDLHAPDLTNYCDAKTMLDLIPYFKEAYLEDDCQVSEYYFKWEGQGYKVICDLKRTEDGDSSISIGITPYELTPANKGVIELLWEIFGGTETEKGYKLLDSHIGAIYGDAITRERCSEICKQLRDKGFASTNIVFGYGSYGFQGNTRDTFGFALKATYAVIDEEERFLFKNPITDSGVKKSQRGRVVVISNKEGNITYIDGLDRAQESCVENNLLQSVFKDGKLLKETSLQEIRTLVSQGVK